MNAFFAFLTPHAFELRARARERAKLIAELDEIDYQRNWCSCREKQIVERLERLDARASDEALEAIRTMPRVDADKMLADYRAAHPEIVKCWSNMQLEGAPFQRPGGAS